MIQKNVLIVDDDEDMLDVISASLGKDGYHAVTAQTGKEALEKLEEGFFDIAFVDIKMPDISGVQILESIKEISPETVVVMITGFASVETAVETIKSGAYDYITKPFKMDKLREIIEKAIESPGLPEELKEYQELKRLKTGIKSLDEILGGGIPLYSVNVISGAAGTGKSILCQQIAFSNAHTDNKVLYVSTLSEPMAKLIRYQQQFSFFDKEKLDKSVIYGDIAEVIIEQGPESTIETLLSKVNESDNIKIVIIDSFKAVGESVKTMMESRVLAYNLAVQLAKSKCTSFLIGEYTEREIEEEPIFAVADGIIQLTNAPKEMDDVRYLKVLKMRGGNYFAGMHSFSINSDGIAVYPRMKTPVIQRRYDVSDGKLSTGIEGLNEMLHGGIPKGTSTLVVGGAGTGKTLLGLCFIQKGIDNGEPGLIVTFQETPSQLSEIAKRLGWDIEGDGEGGGMCKLLYTSPVELNVDKHATQIKEAVAEIGAQRVMIDSIVDIESAISNQTRYKDYIYSLVNFFKEEGVSSLLTNEIPELFGDVQLTSSGISFISDNVILLRYVELESSITRAVSVLKMRGFDHDKAIREFKIDSSGITVMDKFKGQEAILTGKPTKTAGSFEALMQKMQQGADGQMNR